LVFGYAIYSNYSFARGFNTRLRCISTGRARCKRLPYAIVFSVAVCLIRFCGVAGVSPVILFFAANAAEFWICAGTGPTMCGNTIGAIRAKSNLRHTFFIKFAAAFLFCCALRRLVYDGVASTFTRVAFRIDIYIDTADIVYAIWKRAAAFFCAAFCSFTCFKRFPFVLNKVIRVEQKPICIVGV